VASRRVNGRRSKSAVPARSSDTTDTSQPSEDFSVSHVHAVPFQLSAFQNFSFSPLYLDGNPLDDIGNTRKINSVVYGGRLFRKSALEEVLAEVEASARNWV
jgi:hypothetical protein